MVLHGAPTPQPVAWHGFSMGRWSLGVLPRRERGSHGEVGQVVFRSEDGTREATTLSLSLTLLQE